MATTPIDRQGDGVARIAFERRRQVDIKRWSRVHDDEHDAGELALAACAYAAPEPLYRRIEYADGVSFRDGWPQDWARQWDKRPRDDAGVLKLGTRLPIDERIRCLEKAGALIAAEIDRLLRLQAKVAK